MDAFPSRHRHHLASRGDPHLDKGHKDKGHGGEGVDGGGSEVDNDLQHDHKAEEQEKPVDELVNYSLKRTFDGTAEKDTRKKSKLGGKLASHLQSLNLNLTVPTHNPTIDVDSSLEQEPLCQDTSLEEDEDAIEDLMEEAKKVKNIESAVKLYKKLQAARLELPGPCETLDALLDKVDKKIKDCLQRKKEQEDELEEMMRPILRFLRFVDQLE